MTHDVVVVLAPLFLFAHFLFDFPLQGDFLSRAKNPLSPLPGVSWRWALAAHSTLQGGGVAICVFIATQDLYLSLVLGLAETFLHGLIDLGKCLKMMDFGTDQLAHLSCKLAWVTLTVVFSGG